MLARTCIVLVFKVANTRTMQVKLSFALMLLDFFSCDQWTETLCCSSHFPALFIASFSLSLSGRWAEVAGNCSERGESIFRVLIKWMLADPAFFFFAALRLLVWNSIGRPSFPLGCCTSAMRCIITAVNVELLPCPVSIRVHNLSRPKTKETCCLSLPNFNYW